MWSSLPRSVRRPRRQASSAGCSRAIRSWSALCSSVFKGPISVPAAPSTGSASARSAARTKPRGCATRSSRPAKRIAWYVDSRFSFANWAPMSSAFICGCAATMLTPDERAFFTDVRPWGLFLFQRNIASAQQVQELVGSFRDAVGDDDAPVLIDQEGGRVQRLGPPSWPSYPPARSFGALYQSDKVAALKALRQ